MFVLAAKRGETNANLADVTKRVSWGNSNPLFVDQLQRKLRRLAPALDEEIEGSTWRVSGATRSYE
jgi:hypothetical protein